MEAKVVAPQIVLVVHSQDSRDTTAITTPTDASTSSNAPQDGGIKSSGTSTVVTVTIGIGSVLVLAILIYTFILRRRNRSKKEPESSSGQVSGIAGLNKPELDVTSSSPGLVLSYGGELDGTPRLSLGVAAFEYDLDSNGNRLSELPAATAAHVVGGLCELLGHGESSRHMARSGEDKATTTGAPEDKGGCSGQANSVEERPGGRSSGTEKWPAGENEGNKYEPS